MTDLEGSITARESILRSIRQHLLASAPHASREAKRLVGRVASAGALSFTESEPVFAETADLIARLRGAAEGQEGMRAFLEKRPPSWVSKVWRR